MIYPQEGMWPIKIHIERKLSLHSFLHFTPIYWAPTMAQGKLHLLKFEDRELPPDTADRHPQSD